jgi:hypothetical protein
LIDLLEPPMKQLLKQKLKKREKEEAGAPKQGAGKPNIKAVGGG